MIKNTIVCLLSLSILILCQSCKFGGGGAMYHTPPTTIKSGEDTIIEEKHALLSEGRLKPSERYSDFSCYYRFTPETEFKKIPGQSFGETKKEISVKYTIPARELSPGQKLEYYLQSKMDGHQNTTNIYSVSL